MGTVVKYKDDKAIAERDREAFNMRLRGITENRIAEHFKCTVAEVEAGIASMLGGITPDLRTRIIKLELERLEQLIEAHFPQALKGEVEHTDRVIKVMERRSRMLGLDAPPSGGGDALQNALNRDKVTSTNRIIQALDRIAAEKTIEGTAKDVTPEKPDDADLVDVTPVKKDGPVSE